VKVLLDSHALIWAVDDPKRLSSTVAAALLDPANQVFVSAATLWEIAIKVRIGKLKLSEPYRPWIEKATADLGASLLPIAVSHCKTEIGLPEHHRDPFDRMLAAQAIVEGYSLASSDAVLDQYGVGRLW
jgi:PIN domain nuclease of toxin-antitoxin system